MFYFNFKSARGANYKKYGRFYMKLKYYKQMPRFSSNEECGIPQHQEWFVFALAQIGRAATGFGCYCSPSHSSDLFFRPIFLTINLVLLVTFKRIKLKCWVGPIMKIFSGSFQLLPIFCKSIHKLVSYDLQNFSYFMGIMFYFSEMELFFYSTFICKLLDFVICGLQGWIDLLLQFFFLS